MITLNGKKFAKNEKELLESLFISGGTCVGTYKSLKNKIQLFNLQNDLIGVITCFRVLCKAYKKEDGKYFYTYGDIEEVGRFESYSQEVNDIVKALNKCNIALKY